MDDFDRRLAVTARGQQALVTRHDFREAGGTKRQLESRVRRGLLDPLAPSVFAVGGAPRSRDMELLAAMLGGRGRIAVSHLGAARRLGIPGYTKAPMEISVERGVRLRRHGVKVHESTDLDRCALWYIDGIPTTEPARTILDLGRYIGPHRLLRNSEWCRREQLLDWSDLISTLGAHARRGRAGVRLLRELLAANAHRLEVTDADLEVLVLALLREHGLPEPVLHHKVFDGDRFVAEVDLAYPNKKIAMECDGDVHLQEEVRERDLPRQNDLALLGWCVLRFSRQRYFERPQRILADVRDALRAR